MADRPILFSGPIIRALLDGRKTQTRRLLRPQPVPFAVDSAGTLCEVAVEHIEDDRLPRIRLGRCITTRELRFAVGDQLWVRETWQGLSFGDYQPTKNSQCEVRYAATDPCADLDADARGYPWRPSIFMPPWASRLTLIVTDVSVERLQDISEADAIAEGIERSKDFPDRFMTPAGDYAVPIVAYQRLWESINGPGSWEANPWVAAYTFTVIKQNIDQIEKVAA
ncbi:hypothetical protein [Sinorhizobium medicae]|uniref:hypothetical protein n=1 Tax=Sinorhizobium medicae TaxID=110321 RepID=UPI000FD8C345|nr:hypothetical protein [Sinorhizobium medicae]RVJ26624.1 hypothetical protein CN179_21130 [Sinorhizobium medicae]